MTDKLSKESVNEQSVHPTADAGSHVTKPTATTPPTPRRCQASDRLVALTTTAVLNIPRQHKDLVVVPLGAVLSPTPSLALPTYACEPATCTNCGAFISVYSPASGARGEWHCNFCLHLNSSAGSNNPLGKGSSGSGTVNGASTPASLASAPSLAAPESPFARAAAPFASSPAELASLPSLQPNSFITPPAPPSLGPAPAAAAAAVPGRVGSGTLPATPLTPAQPPLQQEAVDYIASSPALAGALSPLAGTAAAAAAAATAGGAAGALGGGWALPTGGQALKGVTVVAVDLAATPQDLQAVQCALLQAIDSLPPSSRVALVASGTAVQAFRLGAPNSSSVPCDAAGSNEQPQAPAVQCDVLPGNVWEGQGLLGALRAGVHVARAGECRGALHATLRSLRPYKPGGPPRPRCIPGLIEAALHLCQLPFGDDNNSRTQQQHQQEPPAQQQQQGQQPAVEIGPSTGGHPGQAAELGLGTPLRLAGPQAQLMDRHGAGRPPGHVVLVTTGKAVQARMEAGVAAGGGADPDGKQQWQGSLPQESAQVVRGMSSLANRAALSGVTIDVVAGGPDPDQISAVSPLAQGTAGLFVQHRACDEAFAANIISAVRRPAGLTASLEVRTSSGLAVRDTYGAVVPLFAAGRPSDQWQALTGGAAPPPPRWLNRRTWHYRCSPPNDSGGVTLVLYCDKPPMQTYVYVQVVWSWVDEVGNRVQRIVTRRLSTTHNPVSVVEALNPGVAAIVWAKTLVAQALEKGAAFDRKEAEILRRSLGKRLFEFVCKFGFPVEGSRGWFSGPSSFALPGSFLPIAHTLYCLHRGPMLHHGRSQHPEERALLQLSQVMCVPSLYLLTHLPNASSNLGAVLSTMAAKPAASSDPAVTVVAAAAGRGASMAEGGSKAAAAAAAGGGAGDAEGGLTAAAGGGDSPSDGSDSLIPGVSEGNPIMAGFPSPPRIRIGSHGSPAGLRLCFKEVPAVDLSLYDAPAAVLDCGSHLYTWLAEGVVSGSERSAAEVACRQFALELGGGRMPVPEVVADSGQLLARLVPIRSDPLRSQLQQAPQLAAASRSLLERAARQLGLCEEPSFFQWLQEHGVQQIADG
ncbi:hypothetical protein N2152v2_005122 [Parachlorella kessleri]